MSSPHLQPAVQTTRTVVRGGISLNLHLWGGDRVPFLLVHGLASNARMWAGAASALAAQSHAVAAIDLRGHGRSDKPAGGYDFETLSHDLVAVIHELGWERPVVAGQSWGGNVVLEMAARHPGSASGLVLVDGGWIDLSRFATWQECERELAPPATEGMPAAAVEAEVREQHPGWSEEAISAQLACFERRSDGTVAPWLTRPRHLMILRRLWEHRPARLYPQVELPVLLVPCDDGSPAIQRKREEVAAAERGLHRCRTQWMAAHHDVHAQHPDAVARLLLECLDDGFFS